MDPINYLGMMPQVDLGQKFLTGLQVGAGIGEIQQQADARQLALQQKQIEMQRAAQYQSDVSAALAAPPDQQAQLLYQVALRNPAQSEAITKVSGAMTSDQQRVALKDAAEFANLLHAGRDDLVKQEITQRITAAKNSGLPTSDLEALQNLLNTDRDKAYAHALHSISILPGGADVLKNIAGLNDEARKAAESASKLKGEAADLTIKNLGIVGQTLGSLQGKNAKPAQAITAIKSLQARGVLSADEAQAKIDSVPTDPKALDDWFGQQRAAGMTSKEQQGYVTPDANAQLQAQTSRYATDSAARTAGARLAFDKDQANAADGPDNTPEAEKKLWVHQYVAGNGSVPRSAPANVRSHIGTWAAEMGITPDDLSSGSAKAKFDQASAVTSGHRAGSMASVEATMPALVSNARNLSRQLGQGKFVPLNQLTQMANDKISDPKLAAFKVGHQALVSEYQQVISRGGTNVTALKEAMHVLNSAKSDEAYNAALDQVDKEVAINVAGTRAVRAGLGGSHGAAPAPAAAVPALPAGWTVKVH